MYMLSMKTDERLLKAESITNEYGTPVENEDGLAGYSRVDSVLLTCHQYDKQNNQNETLDDFLITTSNEFVISERLVTLFKECVVCPSLRYIPALFDESWGVFSGDRGYCLVHAFDVFSVYHSRHSEFDEIGGRRYRIRKWVLDSTKLPPLDLFQSTLGKWFVSEQLMSKIKSASITGFEFVAVPTK